MHDQRGRRAVRARARARLVILALGALLPRGGAAETVTGRVTFVGTLGEALQPDGSLQARFRFRLSESSCGTTDGLWTRDGDGTSWTAWRQVPPAPVAIASDPAAVAWGQGIGVFALGADNHVYGTAWDGTRWADWAVIGSDLFSSGPAVASWSENRVDLFARGMADNALWTNIWRGTWSGWSQVKSTPIVSDLAAVSWGPNHIDVFARGADNTTQTITMNGNQWSNWSAVGGETFNSGPGVASYAANQLSLFARGTDNALYSNFRTGTGPWAGWRQVAPQSIASDPGAASRGPLSVDVFALGTDSQIYRNVLNMLAGWSGWTSLGAERLGSGPAAVLVGGRLHLFVRGRPRIDRWYHATSGRMDEANPHNASSFRNAYNTLLSGFLARTVVSAQVDGVPGCDEFHDLALERAQIGLYP